MLNVNSDPLDVSFTLTAMFPLEKGRSPLLVFAAEWPNIIVQLAVAFENLMSLMSFYFDLASVSEWESISITCSSE